MHQIMLRNLKFLPYWWSCILYSVTFCWFALHETLILLSFCVFTEMVNCLNTIILKSFLIIVFTSILHLFYRTIIPLKICTTHIFLSIEFSILLLVTSYLPTLYRNSPIFSHELWHFTPQVQKRHDYVMKRTRKSIKNQFLFSNGDNIVIYVSTGGHLDCTTLQHHCTAFGFASGYAEVLQDGTISMPTDRHDNL